MLQPLTLTYRNAVPTGIFVDPYVRANELTIRGQNPLYGFSGIGGGLGLGDITVPQLESLAATGASTTVALLGAFSVISGPVGAGIAAGIAVAMEIAQFFKGCGQTCVETSNWANQIEPTLLKNLNNYLASPIRTTSMQAAYLNNFDTVWATLVKACGNSQLGAAGQRCISDRQSGACVLKASPNGWVKNADGTCTYTPAGAAGSGSMCWNWFVGYRDPIANDPCVMPDSVLQQALDGGSTGTQSSSSGPSASTSNPASGSASLLGNIPMPVILGVGFITLIALMGGRD